MGRGRKRPGPQVDTAQDGLPYPVKPLNDDAHAYRRACVEFWGGNMAAMARDLGITRKAVANKITGNRGVDWDDFEAVAKALERRTGEPWDVNRLRLRRAIYGLGVTIKETEPEHIQAARNLRAAAPNRDFPESVD